MHRVGASSSDLRTGVGWNWDELIRNYVFSTLHAFQGRTVDNVVASMGKWHLHLTKQKSFYVERIGRASWR